MNYLTRSVFFICFCFLPLSVRGNTPLICQLSAKSAILIDAKTGAVLYEKASHVPSEPASTSKIITALYALEKKGGSLGELVCVSPDAIATAPAHIRRASHPPYRLEVGGTHMNLRKQEILSLETLLYGLMLSSANDAANVIAEYVAGSIPKFVEELNHFVREKGCKETFLSTPHGLTHKDHTTTAYDLAQLTRIALQNPTFRKIVKTVKFPRPATPETFFVQHNALLKPGRFYYPKAIGVKTGYTLAAGHTLVAAAEDESRSLIAVVFGCERQELRYQDAITLFEAAFQEKRVSRTLFAQHFEAFHHSFPGAKTAVQAVLAQDLLLSYYPSETPSFTIHTEWSPPSFPIFPGQVVGRMLAKSKTGQVLCEQPLIASNRVEETLSHLMKTYYVRQNLPLRKIVPFLLGILLLGGAFRKYGTCRVRCIRPVRDPTPPSQQGKDGDPKYP